MKDQEARDDILELNERMDLVIRGLERTREDFVGKRIAVDALCSKVEKLQGRFGRHEHHFHLLLDSLGLEIESGDRIVAKVVRWVK